MPTTTNFGWTTPADTDLVKDGAAAIRTLGNGIDTSLLDLKGGTTGQILSKASNTDLDYTWINNDQGDLTGLTAGVGITITSATGPVPTITNSSTDLITTAGDILYGTAADTVARLGIGTAGQVLTVNSGATAPEWKTIGGGESWTLLNAGGTALTGATTITVSGISGQEKLAIFVDGASSANASSSIRIRFNSNTAADYITNGFSFNWAATYNDANYATSWASATGLTQIELADMSSNAASRVWGNLVISGAKGTGMKLFTAMASATEGGGADHISRWQNGIYEEAAAITSVSIISSTGNLDNGTVYVWGSAN